VHPFAATLTGASGVMHDRDKVGNPILSKAWQAMRKILKAQKPIQCTMMAGL
jgi:hypothetical protein